MDPNRHHKILSPNLVLNSVFHKWPSHALLFFDWSLSSFPVLVSASLYLIFLFTKEIKILLYSKVYILLSSCTPPDKARMISNRSLLVCHFYFVWWYFKNLLYMQISEMLIKEELWLYPKRCFSETSQWNQI